AEDLIGPTSERAPMMDGTLSFRRLGGICLVLKLAGTRPTPSIQLRLLLTAFTALVLATSSASAQQPGRAITIVVPYTPGTGPDILARVMGEEIQHRWGQPVIVENKPGASGNIGTQAVARAAPDGHTLMLTTSPFTQNVSLFKS